MTLITAWPPILLEAARKGQRAGATPRTIRPVPRSLRGPRALTLMPEAMPRKRRQIEQPGAVALYDELLAKQDGGCAICGAKPKTRRLHIDHDHATGKVRGLLCYRCNRALPSWVTRDWLTRAFHYLGPSQ